MQTTLWKIWASFVSAVAIYLVIAYFLLDTFKPTPDVVRMIALVTALLSATCAIISIILRIKLLVAPIQDGALDIHSDSGFKKYQTILIINWSLSESIAIFGLIMVMFSGVFYHVFPYGVVSVALLLFHMPNLQTVE